MLVMTKGHVNPNLLSHFSSLLFQPQNKCVPCKKKKKNSHELIEITLFFNLQNTFPFNWTQPYIWRETIYWVAFYGKLKAAVVLLRSLLIIFHDWILISQLCKWPIPFFPRDFLFHPHLLYRLQGSAVQYGLQISRHVQLQSTGLFSSIPSTHSRYALN